MHLTEQNVWPVEPNIKGGILMYKHQLYPKEAYIRPYPGVNIRASWACGGCPAHIDLDLPGEQRYITLTGEETAAASGYKCHHTDRAIERINEQLDIGDCPSWSHQVEVITPVNGYNVFITCDCRHEHQSCEQWYINKRAECAARDKAARSSITEVNYKFDRFCIDFPHRQDKHGTYYMILPNGKELRLEMEDIKRNYITCDEIPQEVTEITTITSGCDINCVYKISKEA